MSVRVTVVVFIGMKSLHFSGTMRMGAESRALIIVRLFISVEVRLVIGVCVESFHFSRRL